MKNDVLIVEDHPFVAEATKKLLAGAHPLLNITICSDAASAVQELGNPDRTWHRVLLDLDVPGAHGLSLVMEAHRLGYEGITCIVTAMDRREYETQIQALGFLGYIVKATSVDDFTNAINLIFKGERVFPTPIERRREVNEAIRLTRRQLEVLNLVRTGLSSKQIAEALNLSEGTVNNHITGTLTALEVGTRSHAVARAIELGLLSVSA
ncbi:two-component system response regulator DesR [Variovorax boronicumulans]|uniref:Two-component system response regulator DesR n=1 Tax=Variovorax boronicumulans TaxID=436515 RepID=A0AAW8DC35_9BURK|nr:response regulator transcription factor [Variovorax boronicumulans]MDP9897346.1 two-component system response regulator DesR [Variovorax boronicumulans]MDQ0057420.1 two-component system response regulator DesR [Variovorax boronicumulans]